MEQNGLNHVSVGLLVKDAGRSDSGHMSPYARSHENKVPVIDLSGTLQPYRIELYRAIATLQGCARGSLGQPGAANVSAGYRLHLVDTVLGSPAATHAIIMPPRTLTMRLSGSAI